MKVNTVRLDAIWCAAEKTGPRRATNSAMNVKAVTSTSMVAPIGSPSLTSARMAPGPGRVNRAKTPNSEQSDWRAHHDQARIAVPQEIVAVAAAQPAAPMPREYMKTVLSGTLNTRPMRLRTMIARGRPMPVMNP